MNLKIERDKNKAVPNTAGVCSCYVVKDGAKEIALFPVNEYGSNFNACKAAQSYIKGYTDGFAEAKSLAGF